MKSIGFLHTYISFKCLFGQGNSEENTRKYLKLCVYSILEDKSEEIELKDTDKKQIESDVREIAGIEDINSPVVLDFESVKITKPGKYLLDISNLFSKERPLVYKLEDGKYVIDLVSTFNSKNKD